jgi:hypothetical protein
VAQTTYIIALRDPQALQSAYRRDLQAAMDLLAPRVAADLTVPNNRQLRKMNTLLRLLTQQQQQQENRQLQQSQQVRVVLPTEVDGMISTRM